MKKLITVVMALLGITAFAETSGKKHLTEEQKAKMLKFLGKEKSENIIATLDAYFVSGIEEPANELNATHMATIVDLKNQLTAATSAQTDLQAQIDALKPDASEKTKLVADLSAAQSQIETMSAAIKLLSAENEKEPKAIKTPGAENTLNPMDEKFLFGINQPMMAIDASRPYNMRAYAALAERNGLMIGSPKASSTDYSQLKTDLGDYYRIRKTDRIQSFLVDLPSMEKLFPLESGYQDQAALVNVFMADDFSQAENTGSAFDNMTQGGFRFEAEIIKMFDVMFAHKFTNLKELEKNWLGYLNREGSNVMKMSFVEFILVETAKKLMNERELRRVQGRRINPSLNVKGTAMGAADGLYQFLKNQIALFKIKPHVLGVITGSNIASKIYDFISLIPAALRDSGRMELNLPSWMVVLYHKNLESLYGLNQDYKANIMFVKEYPSVKINAILNADNIARIFVTLAGNIVLLEDKPGEMRDFNLEQQDWTLKVWSNWKESVWAYMVGKKYASEAEQTYDYQMIFCNEFHLKSDYFLAMAADDTTPSAAVHTSLITVANTVATAITNIDDVAIGQEVTLKYGNATNGSTIAVAGNFSLITAAWTGQTVGDTITLKKRSDGKFIELSRSSATPNAIAFADNDATPSVAGGTEFVTYDNTLATAITTFDDAVTGIVYKINGAGAVNPSTIANAGDFVLTAAMTLGAGTWITVQKASNGKFYEIARNV